MLTRYTYLPHSHAYTHHLANYIIYVILTYSNGDFTMVKYSCTHAALPRILIILEVTAYTSPHYDDRSRLHEPFCLIGLPDEDGWMERRMERRIATTHIILAEEVTQPI